MRPLLSRDTTLIERCCNVAVAFSGHVLIADAAGHREGGGRKCGWAAACKICPLTTAECSNAVVAIRVSMFPNSPTGQPPSLQGCLLLLLLLLLLSNQLSALHVRLPSFTARWIPECFSVRTKRKSYAVCCFKVS